MAFGAALAASGLVFTAVAAVAAQVSPSARFARGADSPRWGSRTAHAISDAGDRRKLSWLSR